MHTVAPVVILVNKAAQKTHPFCAARLNKEYEIGMNIKHTQLRLL